MNPCKRDLRPWVNTYKLRAMRRKNRDSFDIFDWDDDDAGCVLMWYTNARKVLPGSTIYAKRSYCFWRTCQSLPFKEKVPSTELFSSVKTIFEMKISSLNFFPHRSSRKALGCSYYIISSSSIHSFNNRQCIPYVENMIGDCVQGGHLLSSTHNPLCWGHHFFSSMVFSSSQ